MAFRYLSSREITNYWRPTLFLVKITLSQSIFRLNFWSVTKMTNGYFEIQNKRNRNDNVRRSTHDVTENISTFATKDDHFKCWFNVELLMESFLNISKLQKARKRSYTQFISKTKPKMVILRSRCLCSLMVMLILHTSTCNRELKDFKLQTCTIKYVRRSVYPNLKVTK